MNIETTGIRFLHWRHVPVSISDERKGYYRFVPMDEGEVFHIEDEHRFIRSFVGISNFMAPDTEVIVRLKKDNVGYACKAQLIVRRAGQADMATEITLRTSNKRLSKIRSVTIKNYYRCIASAA